MIGLDWYKHEAVRVLGEGCRTNRDEQNARERETGRLRKSCKGAEPSRGGPNAIEFNEGEAQNHGCERFEIYVSEMRGEIVKPREGASGCRPCVRRKKRFSRAFYRTVEC